MDLIGGQSADNARVHLRFGRRVIVLDHRYENQSSLNDIFIGIFFTVEGALFFFTELETGVITLFLLGSIDFLLRPVIRLARRIPFSLIVPSNGGPIPPLYGAHRLPDRCAGPDRQ